MDTEGLSKFLASVIDTLNDEIDNIADDELVNVLNHLVMEIADAYNYIRFVFEG